MKSVTQIFVDISKICVALAFLSGALGICFADSAQGFNPPPGTYHTSWVGNSFGGDGGPNGFGYWVQNGADEIEVSPDGTVIAGLGWDEAGRCVGLYKNGQVNRVLLQTEGDGLPDSAWGWGTGNNALALDGENIYVANTGKKLLHFRWTPGDINSGAFVSAVNMDNEAVGLNALGDDLIVVYKDAIEHRHAGDFSVIGKFNLSDARDATIAPDGKLWILAGNAVKLFSFDGQDMGVSIPGLQNPSAISFGRDKKLIVCEDGSDQQVLFFDVSGVPQQVATFGKKGGLLAGIPGLVMPDKFFALRGAGTDDQGNLYVSMSFGNGPAGNLFIRSFTPTGELRWELMSTAFVDTFGFDPNSDGAVVYSRTAVFDLDLTKTKPGSEWSLRAVTIDHVHHPDDDRMKYGCTALLRRLEGRRVFYCIGQYAGGYNIYTFDKPDTYIAQKVDQINGDDQWAWDVTDNGDIWHGDAPGKMICRYPFKGWTSDGKPIYDWQNSESWHCPEGWSLIRRINYDPSTDSLYLTGYLEGQRVETWGVIGASAKRYDGWLKGKQNLVWTNKELPRDGNTNQDEGPLTPQAMDIAGDYMFLGMVKPTDGKQFVHIMRLSDGSYIGTFKPGPETGDGHGWLDMPYAVQAFKRQNGEYLILVEEDWRGKNLLYRWRPDGME
jgi:hypothetical protein